MSAIFDYNSRASQRPTDRGNSKNAQDLQGASVTANQITGVTFTADCTAFTF